MTNQEAVKILKNGARHSYSSGYRIAVDVAIKALEEQDRNRWIPVSERLPEEKTSPYTFDYYYYECTFFTDGVKEVRYYQFGKGTWWRKGEPVDIYVTAWKERPEPYKEDTE